MKKKINSIPFLLVFTVVVVLLPSFIKAEEQEPNQVHIGVIDESNRFDGGYYYGDSAPGSGRRGKSSRLDISQIGKIKDASIITAQFLPNENPRSYKRTIPSSSFNSIRNIRNQDEISFFNGEEKKDNGSIKSILNIMNRKTRSGINHAVGSVIDTVNKEVCTFNLNVSSMETEYNCIKSSEYPPELDEPELNIEDAAALHHVNVGLPTDNDDEEKDNKRRMVRRQSGGDDLLDRQARQMMKLYEGQTEEEDEEEDEEEEEEEERLLSDMDGGANKLLRGTTSLSSSSSSLVETFSHRAPSKNRTTKNRNLVSDDGSVLDLMVVWTSRAECNNAGLSNGCTLTQDTEDAMISRIYLAVEETNTMYTISGVQTQLRLVHSYHEPNYVEYSDSQYSVFRRALRDLSWSSDAYMNDVHTKRDSYGADIVALFIHESSSCGVAWIGPSSSSMFSVSAWNCATGYFTFGHEIGHNMGCRHDRGQYGYCNSNLNAYIYGYRNPLAEFRTMMAYDCDDDTCPGHVDDDCTRVQRISTSDSSVTYNGKIVGDASNDNVRQINNVIATIAGYKTSVPSCNDDGDCDDSNPCTENKCIVEDGLCQLTFVTCSPWCGENQIRFQLDLTTDNYPAYTEWTLTNDCTNSIELSGGPYSSSGETTSIDSCIDNHQKYTFTVDYGPIRMTSRNGNGYLEVNVNNMLLLQTQVFDNDVQTRTFGNSCDAPTTTTTTTTPTTTTTTTTPTSTTTSTTTTTPTTTTPTTTTTTPTITTTTPTTTTTPITTTATTTPTTTTTTPATTTTSTTPTTTTTTTTPTTTTSTTPTTTTTTTTPTTTTTTTTTTPTTTTTTTTTTTNPNQWTLINSEDFETGWGIYADGGGDASRYSSSRYSNSGTFSIRLRDNSGVGSSITTETIDTSSYNEIQITFTFIGYSMEAGEDLLLEVDHGVTSTFEVEERWISGTDFTNNVRLSNIVVIVDVSNDNSVQIRFKCDASSNADRVYIDDIVLEGK